MILYYKWHDLAPESQRSALLFSQWVCRKTLSFPTTDTSNTVKICWIVLPKWWAIHIVVWTVPLKAGSFSRHSEYGKVCVDLECAASRTQRRLPGTLWQQVQDAAIFFYLRRDILSCF